MAVQSLSFTARLIFLITYSFISGALYLKGAYIETGEKKRKSGSAAAPRPCRVLKNV